MSDRALQTGQLMKLSEIITEELVVENLSAKNSREVIRELVRKLVDTGQVPPEKERAAINGLMQREKRASTGIANALAVPHIRVAYVDRVVGVVGRAGAGIDFGAIDGEPTEIFLLFLIPKEPEGLAVNFMSHVVQMIRKPHFTSFVRQAGTAAEILDVLRDAEAM